MALPTIDDHAAVKAAKQKLVAAQERKDKAEEALKAFDEELFALEAKSKLISVTVEELEALRDLRPKAQPLREERDIARKGYGIATRQLGEAKDAAKRELRNSKAVQKSVAKVRADLIKAVEAFVEAQRASIALFEEGNRAGLWSHAGEFGDAPKMSISILGISGQSTLLSTLEYQLSQMRESGKKAA